MKTLFKLSFFIITMAVSNMTKADLAVSDYTTKNGVKVLFVKSANIPMIDIKITFNAGADQDGSLKGLSMLTHNLLDEGTKKMNSEDIASVFESTGAIFNTSVNKDKSSVSLRSLTDKKYFDPSIKMFLTILSESIFPKNEFDIQKNRTISSIIEEESDPSEIASNLFFKEMYGKHPYASPTNGLKNTVKKIQRKDVLNFYKKNINANTAKIAIVSPLSKNDIIKLVEKISKSLNHSKISGKPINTAVKKNKGKYIFKKSNSEQAHIYVGTLSIKRGSDNNFPLYVGNYIFGGSGFSARLMQELRVKRGLTYGVYSYVYPMKEIGPFVIGIETKSEQAQLSVKLIQDMVKDFYKKGPTEKELNDAKQAIINGFPLRIDSNSDILNYLSIINYYNLPIDYLSTFTSNISNLTKKDIISAFQEEIDIDNLITLVVGNEKAKKK